MHCETVKLIGSDFYLLSNHWPMICLVVTWLGMIAWSIQDF